MHWLSQCGVSCYRAQRVMNRVCEMRSGKGYDSDFSRRTHDEGICADLIRQSFTKTAERLGLLF